MENRLEKLEQLLIKTKDVRNMQKEYFRTRSWNTCQQCKIVEKELDDIIKEMEKEPADNGQKNLF